MAKVPFHVQHNTTPDKLEVILKLYRSEPSISSSELAVQLGLSASTVQRVILPFVREMRLIGDEGLTDVGRDIADLVVKGEEIWREAIHVWFYTLHLLHRDTYPSWSYAKVTDWLWDRGEVELSISVRDRIVGEVVREAGETFNMPQNRIAFSRSSVNGVLNWLKALSKPVIFSDSKKSAFRRRDFCPMMTFLWALDAIYRENRVRYGTRLRLTEERKDRLFRICLIQPESLDNLISHTRRNLDYNMGGIFGEGFEGGFGRWVLLSKSVPVGRMI